MKDLIISALMVAPVAACSVPAAPQAPQETTKLETGSKDITRTVKPGADVQIRSELRGTVSAGGSGALNVSLTEGYTRGDMQVTVSTSPGLELITTIDATEFNMASGDTHEWTLYFSAPEAGKHYINFHVTVDTALGPLSRSSAAIVQVGNVTDAPVASEPEKAPETDSEGKPVIRMQAKEVIIQGE